MADEFTAATLDRCASPGWFDSRAWSTFGPHPIGTERFPTVSSGTLFAQVAGAILQKQARGQNPDKDEVRGPDESRSLRGARRTG